MLILGVMVAAMIGLFELPYRLDYKKGSTHRRLPGFRALVGLLEEIPELDVRSLRFFATRRVDGMILSIVDEANEAGGPGNVTTLLLQVDGGLKRTIGGGADVLLPVGAADQGGTLAELLERDFDIPSDIWSVTSFNELRRDALEVERWNQLHPEEEPRKCYIEQALGDKPGPYVAATDYMKIVPDQIQRWVPGSFISLGTDGYGRSDARKALREHFEVDRHHIAVAALKALADEGAIDRKTVTQAIRKYGIDPDRPDPVTL